MTSQTKGEKKDSSIDSLPIRFLEPSVIFPEPFKIILLVIPEKDFKTEEDLLWLVRASRVERKRCYDGSSRRSTSLRDFFEFWKIMHFTYQNRIAEGRPILRSKPKDRLCVQVKTVWTYTYFYGCTMDLGHYFASVMRNFCWWLFSTHEDKLGKNINNSTIILSNRIYLVENIVIFYILSRFLCFYFLKMFTYKQ